MAGHKIKLTGHLCESEDPLTSAKSCSLEILSLADKYDMFGDFVKWILSIEPTKILPVIHQYERCQRLTDKYIPFIRSDLHALLHKFGCNYNHQQQGVKKDVIETDGFLYEDLDDALKNLNLLSDQICDDCKSTNVVESNLTLSSNTVNSLVNLFTTVLNGDFSSKNIAIIGSGCGEMTYSAFLFSNAGKIVSYESNDHLCKVQNLIIEKYGMSSRVQIIPMSQDLEPNFVKDVDILMIENITCMDTLFKNALDKNFESQQNFKKGAIIVYCKKNDTDFPFNAEFLVTVNLPLTTPEFHIYRVE